MGPLTDILDRFKERPAEELRSYLEGYNQACVDMYIEKQKRQEETLESLRKWTRIQNTSSNEPNSKGEIFDGRQSYRCHEGIEEGRTT